MKIPRKLIERLLKKYGAKRISSDAKDFIRKKIIDLFENITEVAIKNARYSGRKTIMVEDVEKGFERFKM